MCNPPFYADADELYRHAREKSIEAFSVLFPFPRWRGGLFCGIKVDDQSHVLDPRGRCVLLEAK